jgi:hypothetical protein
MPQRLIAMGLALVVTVTVGCAYMKKTEQLPSPNPGREQGGPDMEDPGYME